MNFLEVLFFTLNLLLIYPAKISSHTHSNKSQSQSQNPIINFYSKSTKEWKTLDENAPLIIGHRGEKVLAPEHTLYGYEMASILGADFVEPDLCLTKDKHFVCFHDLYVSQHNTDVDSHPEFERLKKEMPDGSTKWAIKDFTLKEIKTLRVKQKEVGIRPQALNGMFEIPTFQEYLDLIHQLSFKLNRTIGIIPELKSPAYHNSLHGPNAMENLLLQTLTENGYPVNNNTEENCTARSLQSTGNVTSATLKKIKCPNVIIQSFEYPALEYLKQKTSLDLAMLVFDNPYLLTLNGIQNVSHTAKYYGAYKSLLLVEAPLFLRYINVTYDSNQVERMGGFIPPKDYASIAHSHGLKLVPYTIYDSREPSLLGSSKRTPRSKREELNYFFTMGVDGLFVENVAESLEIRREAEIEIFAASRLREQNQKPSSCKNSGYGSSKISSTNRDYMSFILVLVLHIFALVSCI